MTPLADAGSGGFKSEFSRDKELTNWQMISVRSLFSAGGRFHNGDRDVRFLKFDEGKCGHCD